MHMKMIVRDHSSIFNEGIISKFEMMKLICTLCSIVNIMKMLIKRTNIFNRISNFRGKRLFVGLEFKLHVSPLKDLNHTTQNKTFFKKFLAYIAMTHQGLFNCLELGTKEIQRPSMNKMWNLLTRMRVSGGSRLHEGAQRRELVGRSWQRGGTTWGISHPCHLKPGVMRSRTGQQGGVMVDTGSI